MSDAQPSPVKRIGFSLPFFRKKGDKPAKPVSAEKAEAARRKAVVDEGHRYLSETTELVHENRDHPYMRANGHFTMFQERWSELYGMAPSVKKANKKGKMLPEEFRDHARDLLDDVHSVLQNGKIEPRGSPSSQSQETPHEPVHESAVTLERSKSVARQPSHRRKESRDDDRHHSEPERSGSVRHKDRDESEPHSSSRKNSTRHRRGDTEDDRHRVIAEPIPEEDADRYYESKSRRHRHEAPIMDRKANESSKHSASEDDDSRRRRREERRREEGYRDDRPREDRHRDDRYKEGRYRDDRYRDDRYRDDRYRDDKYDSYRKDRHRDDRYRDDRYRDDRYRDDKYYDDGRRSTRRRGDRYYDDKYRDDEYRDDKYRDDKYRDDKYRDDKYRDSRRRDDRRRDDPRREGRRREEPRDGEGEEQQHEHEHSHHYEDDEDPKHIPPPNSPPVAMSPTYIPYPAHEDESRRRGGGRRHSREESRRHRRGEPSASRNHSPHMGNDSGQQDPDQMVPLMIPPPRARPREHRSRFRENFSVLG